MDWLLSEEEILEQVDEYLLYCFYTGFEPELHIKYRAPYRDDSSPSWGIFERKVKKGNFEFGWKDQGTGKFGDIYDLVKLVCKLGTRAAAIGRVREDFIFGNKKEVIRDVARPISKPARIAIKSKTMVATDIAWWAQFGITPELLKRYHVTRISHYWMFENQASPNFPYDAAYAYRVYDHYKLYFPHRVKDFRFRNDYGDMHLEGFCQLEFNTDTLIITKSLKDVMTLRSLGFEAVSPRGEHTPVHHVFMAGFGTRYHRIFTLFDNDGKHRGWDYKLPAIEIPPDSGEKDVSDYYRKYGKEKTQALIAHMLSNHPMQQIDINKPMSRLEAEEFLESVYLNIVISIQQTDTKLVTGKVDRLSVDFVLGSITRTADDLVCIVMIADTRYEFPLTYFLQKAQIFKHGDTH